MQWSKQGTAVPSRCPLSSTSAHWGTLEQVPSDRDTPTPMDMLTPFLPQHGQGPRGLPAWGARAHSPPLLAVCVLHLCRRPLTEPPGFHDLALILHRVPPVPYDIHVQQVSSARLEACDCLCGHRFLQVLTVEVLTEDLLRLLPRVWP